MSTFIGDFCEFLTKDQSSMEEFLKDREGNSTWFTDETGTMANNIRFMPIYAEPLCVPAEVKTLQAQVTPKFFASEEAYADSMDCPEQGCFGSSQMMLVNGTLWPVGRSAVRSVLERAGIKPEGWEKLKKFNPGSLSKALNIFLEATKGSVCVLVQDEKVRAVNSGRYAICPSTYVMEAMKEWIQTDRPKATFMGGYVSHDFINWNVDLSAYTDEVLGKFPALITGGFKPALQVYLSHTGTSSVSLRPCLLHDGYIFPMSEGIDCPHIGKGSSTERSEKMKDTVKRNFNQVFASLEKAAEKAEKLDSVIIGNAYNAVLRVMKYVGIPKIQGMEAADIFGKINPGSATAYDCFLCLYDSFTFVLRDYKNDNKKQFAVADSVGRSLTLKWQDFDIPGDFSW